MAEKPCKGRYDFVFYRVSDVMTARPITVAPSAPLSEAAAIFDSHEFNGLPVVEGERLVGFFTKLDLLTAFLFTPDSLVPHYDEIMSQPVERFMTRTPLVTEPDTPLTRVLQQIIDTRCKSFPVLDGERMAGIVAREDLLHALRCAVRGDDPKTLPRRSRSGDT